MAFLSSLNVFPPMFLLPEIYGMNKSVYKFITTHRAPKRPTFPGPAWNWSCEWWTTWPWLGCPTLARLPCWWLGGNVKMTSRNNWGVLWLVGVYSCGLGWKRYLTMFIFQYVVFYSTVDVCVCIALKHACCKCLLFFPGLGQTSQIWCFSGGWNRDSLQKRRDQHVTEKGFSFTLR